MKKFSGGKTHRYIERKALELYKPNSEEIFVESRIGNGLIPDILSVNKSQKTALECETKINKKKILKKNEEYKSIGIKMVVLHPSNINFDISLNIENIPIKIPKKYESDIKQYNITLDNILVNEAKKYMKDLGIKFSTLINCLLKEHNKKLKEKNAS